MQFAASPRADATPQCPYEVNNRDQGQSVAFCPTMHDAIRLAMALNLLERQKAPSMPTAPIAPAIGNAKAEARCPSCCHRFPASKMGTMRLTYAQQEELRPCCPMCGAIIALDAMTTPTLDEWWQHYRK